MLNDIAIIAGSGNLPLKIALLLRKRKVKFIVLSIKGFSNFNVYKNFNSFSLRMGQGFKAIKILKKNNIKNIIFLGALDRPTLLSLKPDLWTLFKVFKFIFFKKTDDFILRSVISIFEKEKFRVIGLSDITTNFFLKSGIYGIKNKISNKEKQIIDSLVYKTVNWTRKDLGQSVITSKNNIILTEDRRGTDNLIQRLNSHKYNKNSYLFIKVKKLHQDIRIDLPTFGYKTLKKLVKTNIKYIVLNADSTVLMDKNKVLNYLKKKKKTILSIKLVNSNNKKMKIMYE